jgi:hypothetical protein
LHGILFGIVFTGCECSRVTGSLTYPDAGRDQDVAAPDASDWPNDACFAPCEATWEPLGLDRPVYLASIDERGPLASYDPLRHRMILLDAPSNVVWALPFEGPGANQFEMLNASGDIFPLPVEGGAFDSRRQRIIVFSGESRTFRSTPQLSRVFALDLSAAPTWREISTTPLPPIDDGEVALFYDDRRDLYIAAWLENKLFAVATASAGDVLTWTQHPIQPEKSSIVAGAAGKAFDEVRSRIIWVEATTGSALSIDISDGTLRTLPSVPVGASPSYSGVFDSQSDRVVLFGASGDVWTLSMTATTSWTRLAVANAIPGRFGHSAVYDGDKQRMVIFGGVAATGPNTFAEGWVDDVWALSLDAAPTWSNLVANDPRPMSLWIYDSAAYDSTHDAIIYVPSAFGDHFSPWSWASLPFVTWRLNLMPSARWERIQTTQSPPPGEPPAFVFHPGLDRFLLWGGGATPTDLWSLDLDPTPEWHALSSNGPPPLGSSRAAFVSSPDRMLVDSASMTSTTQPSLFSLSLDQQPTWLEVGTVGAPRLGGPIAYAPDANRVLVVGSASLTQPLDAWILDLDVTPPRWTHVGATGDLPPTNFLGSAAYDPLLRAFVVTTPGYFDITAGCGVEHEWLWMLPLDEHRWRRIESRGVRPGFVRALVPTASGLVGIDSSAWSLSIQCRR